MLHKNRLFTPGPTPLLPAAQTAMASFTAHHRTADFKALFQRVLADMKEFIGTRTTWSCSDYGPSWRHAARASSWSPAALTCSRTAGPLRRQKLLVTLWGCLASTCLPAAPGSGATRANARSRTP